MMNSYINLFLFFISSSRILVSQENCRIDSFKTEPDFDIRKFLGLWYHVTTLTDPNSQEILYDMKYYLKLNDNGSTTMHIAYWIPGDSQCTVYSNLLSSTKIPGKMQRMDIVNAFSTNFGPSASDSFLVQRQTSTDTKPVFDSFMRAAYDIMNFWVVKTNYVSYAVIYGCIDREETYGNCSEARAEVLSRKPSLPDLVQTTVNSSLRSVCVNLADLKTIPQNNMCHFPDNLSAGNMAITAEGGMLLLASFVLILTLFNSIRSL